MVTARRCAQAKVRPARPGDATAITRIDAGHTGVGKPKHWKALLESCRQDKGVALVAEFDTRVVGFLLGEVRAWEFGSPPTGWIYAMGVLPSEQGDGLGRSLVKAAEEWFVTAGARSVRTMVRREDVALLRFFRGAGFAAGPFVQMEMNCGHAP